MQGGELLDQIVESQAFSEREAAEILYTIVKTVNFLHQEGVCSRGIFHCRSIFTKSWVLGESSKAGFHNIPFPVGGAQRPKTQ